MPEEGSALSSVSPRTLQPGSNTAAEVELSINLLTSAALSSSSAPPPSARSASGRSVQLLLLRQGREVHSSFSPRSSSPTSFSAVPSASAVPQRQHLLRHRPADWRPHLLHLHRLRQRPDHRRVLPAAPGLPVPRHQPGCAGGLRGRLGGGAAACPDAQEPGLLFAVQAVPDHHSPAGELQPLRRYHDHMERV